MWAWLKYIFVTALFGTVLSIDVPLNLFIGTGKTISSIVACNLQRIPQEERVMELDRTLPALKSRLE